MAILTAVCILSGAIAVPILCRPFYYAHITPLQIRLRVLLTEEQIKETYDEVMDYCLGITDHFELTHFIWSTEGASHFADVRELFRLDIIIAAISVVLLLILLCFCRANGLRSACIKGHSPGFWAAAGLGTIFAVLGGLAALDFDRAFTAFHAVFFPGKENWFFDAATDPIIDMLPQVFFRNCALLIFALVAGTCGILILKDYRQRKNR